MVTHSFRNRSKILDAVTQLMIEDSAVEQPGLTTRQTRRRNGCAASWSGCCLDLIEELPLRGIVLELAGEQRSLPGTGSEIPGAPRGSPARLRYPPGGSSGGGRETRWWQRAGENADGLDAQGEKAPADHVRKYASARFIEQGVGIPGAETVSYSCVVILDGSVCCESR